MTNAVTISKLKQKSEILQSSYCYQHPIEGVQWRKWSYFHNSFCYWKETAWAPKARSGDLIVLPSTEEVRGHVFFCGGLILQPQHTAAAPWLHVPRNEHIRSAGLHSVTAPWVGDCSLHPWGHKNVSFYSGLPPWWYHHIRTWHQRHVSLKGEGWEGLGEYSKYMGAVMCLSVCMQQHRRRSIPIKRWAPILS